MKKIGITGTVGSGKTFVCGILKKKGYPVFIADELAKQASEKRKNEIVSLLGEDILNSNGEINRSKISEKVFNAPEKLAALNKIIHPAVKLMRSNLFRCAGENGAELVFYESALIFEAGIENEFDAVISVSAGEKLRHRRLKNTREYSRGDISRLELAQFGDDEKRQRADFVLLNENTPEQTTEKLMALIEQIKRT